MTASRARDKPLRSGPAAIEDDFYRWASEQAELLRRKRFLEADLANIFEELESSAKHDRSALKSSYRLVLAHLLMWEHQRERRARSWDRTIIRERGIIADIDDSRSLRNEAPAIVAEAYRRAAQQAAREVRLPVPTFPAECPYTSEQLRDLDWMPE